MWILENKDTKIIWYDKKINDFLFYDGFGDFVFVLENVKIFQ
jgi:hypothetical protein